MAACPSHPAASVAASAHTAAPAAGPQLGRVRSFDPGRGLGTVAADSGTEYGFHATAVADGSRRIEVGTRVAFTVAPGHRGLEEAGAVLPLPSH